MRVLCISASNTIERGDKSASNRVAHLIGDIIQRNHDEIIEVEVAPLMDYNLQPCSICGKCVKHHLCVYDADFNKILNKITESDKVFFVVPHYSPIPSKLIILMEKINQIVFPSFVDKTFQSPVKGITVGIIGHGGMIQSEQVHDYYHEVLVKPISRTLRSIGFNPVGADEHFTNGATFALRDESCYIEPEDSLLPEFIHDMDMIEERISGLIRNVIEAN